MTDKELLELAAKAEGRTLKYMTQHIEGREPEEFIACWNPLTDDGDALRLAVKLGMLASFEPPTESGAVCRIVTDWDTDTGYPKVSATEQHSSDPYAATRRAIVRAAAEVGKGMK